MASNSEVPPLQLQLSTPPPPPTPSQHLTSVQLQFPAQAYASALAPSSSVASFSKSIPDHLMHKNRLQQYTQRSGIPLPVYQTTSEGISHMPSFRSSVLVDKVCYTSPNTFLSRKAAEQDAARVAMMEILEKIKDVEVPPIHQYTMFCKSILNEYAVKRNVEKPIYNTVQTKAVLPVFVSTLVFNGVSYTGDVGKNKKEAEQLAASAVIQSLLGDSGSALIMSEIIRSKHKLYAAFHRTKDPEHSHGCLVPLTVNTEHNFAISTNASIVAVPEASRGMLPPHHEFVKRKLEEPASQATPQLPITFVPSVYEQPLNFSTPFGVSSASAGVTPASAGITPASAGASACSGLTLASLGIASASKKRRKKKKKTNKKLPDDARLPVVTLPMNLNQPPPCSVTQ